MYVSYEPGLCFCDSDTHVSKYIYVGTYQSVKWMFFDSMISFGLNALVVVSCKSVGFFRTRISRISGTPASAGVAQPQW
jgi:hypothetical protein